MDRCSGTRLEMLGKNRILCPLSHKSNTKAKPETPNTILLAQAKNNTPYKRTEVPEFCIKRERKSAGTGPTRVTTDVLMIYADKDDADTLQTMFNMAGEKNFLQSPQYIPIGLQSAFADTPDAMSNVLRKQINFMKESAIIPILNMPQDQMYKEIIHKQNKKPLIELIQHETGAYSVEPSNRTENLGKWFILLPEHKTTTAKFFLDNTLPAIIRNSNRTTFNNDIQLPRRTSKPQMGTKMRSYLSAVIQNENNTARTVTPTMMKQTINPIKVNPIQQHQQKITQNAPKRKVNNMSSQSLNTMTGSSHRNQQVIQETEETPNKTEEQTSNKDERSEIMERQKDQIKFLEQRYMQMEKKLNQHQETNLQHFDKLQKIIVMNEKIQMEMSQKLDTLTTAIFAIQATLTEKYTPTHRTQSLLLPSQRAPCHQNETTQKESLNTCLTHQKMFQDLQQQNYLHSTELQI